MKKFSEEFGKPINIITPEEEIEIKGILSEILDMAGNIKKYGILELGPGKGLYFNVVISGKERIRIHNPNLYFMTDELSSFLQEIGIARDRLSELGYNTYFRFFNPDADYPTGAIRIVITKLPPPERDGD